MASPRDRVRAHTLRGKTLVVVRLKAKDSWVGGNMGYRTTSQLVARKYTPHEVNQMSFCILMAAVLQNRVKDGYEAVLLSRRDRWRRGEYHPECQGAGVVQPCYVYEEDGPRLASKSDSNVHGLCIPCTCGLLEPHRSYEWEESHGDKCLHCLVNLFAYFLREAERVECVSPFPRIGHTSGEPTQGGTGSRLTAGGYLGMGVGSYTQGALYYKHAVRYRLANQKGISEADLERAPRGKEKYYYSTKENVVES